MSILESARSAAAAIAAQVSEDATADSLTTLEAAVKAYSDAKGRIGKAGAAERLGLKEQELVFFEKIFREAGRRSSGEPEGVDARQRDIACLRLISWAETINSRNDDWQIPVDLEGDPSEERARAQVRAVELLLRALITESYKSQDALVERLGGLFKASVVDKWKKSGDKGDILSGTLFSELASLFVNKQEFGRYTELLESDGHLVFLKDRRKTSQDFLEDIRRMRNAVAHNKSLSTAQLQLLNLYFEDLTTPLQGAFDRGDSQVNPDDYLEATPAELASYFKDLQEDVLDIKDDIADLQDALGATEEKVRGLQGGVLTIVSSILVFGVFMVLHLKDWNAMAATAGPETIEWLTQRSQRGNHVAGLLFGIGVIRLVLGRLGVSLPGPLLVSILAKMLPPLRPIEERLAGPAGFVFLLAFAGAGFVYWDSGSLSLAILAGLAALL